MLSLIAINLFAWGRYAKLKFSAIHHAIQKRKFRLHYKDSTEFFHVEFFLFGPIFKRVSKKAGFTSKKQYHAVLKKVIVFLNRSIR